MKKLKNNTKTMLALIAKDQATRLRKRLDQGLAVDQQIKVPGRYKPMTLLEYASEKELRKRHAKERRHYREIIEELVRAGAKLNHITVDESPLYRAAKGGDLEVVKLLLNTGADPNAAINVVPWKNLYRETALHAAARNGAIEIAKALIVAGADTKRNNSEEMRPLEAVIRQERSTEMEGTAWLQRTGVKVDKERVEVERAAWHNRRTQMIKLLSEYSNAEDATHAG